MCMETNTAMHHIHHTTTHYTVTAGSPQPHNVMYNSHNSFLVNWTHFTYNTVLCSTPLLFICTHNHFTTSWVKDIHGSSDTELDWVLRIRRNSTTLYGSRVQMQILKWWEVSWSLIRPTTKEVKIRKSHSLHSWWTPLYVNAVWMTRGRGVGMYFRMVLSAIWSTIYSWGWGGSYENFEI